MTIKKIFLKKERILLVGCGKMGGALLEGWIKNGLSRNDIVVIEPEPSERLRDLGENGLTLNPDFAFEVGVCVLAIKPQNVDNLLRDFPKAPPRSGSFLLPKRRRTRNKTIMISVGPRPSIRSSFKR